MELVPSVPFGIRCAVSPTSPPLPPAPIVAPRVGSVRPHEQHRQKRPEKRKEGNEKGLARKGKEGGARGDRASTNEFVIQAIEVVKNGLEVGEDSRHTYSLLVLISLPKWRAHHVAVPRIEGR